MSNPTQIAKYQGYQETGMPDMPGFHLWNTLVSFYDAKTKQVKPVGTTLVQQTIQNAFPGAVIPENPQPGSVITTTGEIPQAPQEQNSSSMNFESVFLKCLQQH